MENLNNLKWTLKYNYLENQKSITIIEGTSWQFIPRKDEIIILENKLYNVTNIAYDFDEYNIIIFLQYLNDVQTKNKVS